MACGTPITYAGQTYNTVKIGNQCWFKENLNVGTMIDEANNQGTDCSSPTEIQKYCYSNNKNLCASDGSLYQWRQAMCGSVVPGTQGICPTGWHIPTDNEYKILEMALGMSQEEADKMGHRGTNEGDQIKKTGLCRAKIQSPYCADPNIPKKAGLCEGRIPCGTSGFNALLVGGHLYEGWSVERDRDTFFWTSSQTKVGAAQDRRLFLDLTTIARGSSSKIKGFSIRCLND